MNYDAIIADVRKVLAEDLNKEQLGVCLKLAEPLLTAKCDAQRALLIERERLRHPKDKDLTDLDRTTMLNKETADLNHDFELLKGLEELLLLRIEMLSTLFS